MPVISDLIAIPDFSSGAMENWGLITYRMTALLYDPKVSTDSDMERVAVVIAHELAHQVQACKLCKSGCSFCLFEPLMVWLYWVQNFSLDSMEGCNVVLLPSHLLTRKSESTNTRT